MFEVFQLEHPGTGKRRCVPPIACWHDAIEQINPPQNPFQQVDRSTNSHEIAWPIGGKEGHGEVQGLVHQFRFFTNAQAPDGIARKIKGSQPGNGSFAQLLVGSPLHNAKQRLIGSLLCITTT